MSRPDSRVEQAQVSKTGWFYFVTYALLGPLVAAYFRPKVVGRENLPKRGSAMLLASNHVSYLDWIVFPFVLPGRRIVYLAKSEYFTRPGLRGRLQRFFFGATGQVPIDRRGGNASEAALRTATKLLRDGATLGIFPEGTRARDGRLQRGRTGLARMAAATGVPVIPAGTLGLYEAAPAGKRVPRPRRITVVFGEPMYWPEGVEPDAQSLRRWTDELMDRIAELSGQERPLEEERAA